MCNSHRLHVPTRPRGLTTPGVEVREHARRCVALFREGGGCSEVGQGWCKQQDGVRQLARYAIGQDKESMASFLHAPMLGIPTNLVRKSIPVLYPVVSRQMRPKQGTAEACLAALPAQLDRVDALLAEGVIGGPRPNAADFQVAPSVRLMLNFDQLREHVEGRPAGRHALKLVPDYPGRFREVFPAAWLPFE